MCVRCLGKHTIKNCGSKTRCGEGGCKQIHHSLLHSEKDEQREKKMERNLEQQSTNHHELTNENDEIKLPDAIATTSSDANVLVHSNEGTKFQIVPVTLSNGEDEIRTYAFLDSGSKVTMVEDSLMKKLRIKGPKQPLKLKWSSDLSRVENNSHNRVQFYISDIEGNHAQLLKNVRTVEKLQLSVQTITCDEFQTPKRYKHLRSVPLAEYTDAQPQILIGIDNHSLMVPIEIVEGQQGEPVAIRTRLG